MAAVLSNAALLALHAVNYKLSDEVIRPNVPRLGLDPQKAAEQLNADLYSIGISYKVMDLEDTQKSGNSAVSGTRWRPKSGSGVSKVSEVLFNVTISFAMQATALFLTDLVGLLDTGIDWKLTLSGLTLTLSYVVPSWLIQCYLYSERHGSFEQNEFARSFAVVFLSWVAVLRLLAAVFLKSSDGGMDVLRSSLYQLLIVGIACLSILNGTGCVSSIVDLYYRYTSPVTMQDLDTTVASLRTTETLLFARRNGGHSGTTTPDDSSSDPDVALLQGARVDLLRRLEDQVANYKYTNSHSLTGQASRTFDYGFAAYCVYRVFSIIVLQMPVIALEDIGLLSHREADTDPLSTTIATLLTRWDATWDFDTVSVTVNVVFSLCLLVGSFQSVIVTFAKISAWARIQFNGHLADLFVAEITGLYTLATMLLLDRGGLPSHLAELFSKEYMSADFVNVWYDKWFAAACIVTYAALIAMQKLEKGYDEEAMV